MHLFNVTTESFRNDYIALLGTKKTPEESTNIGRLDDHRLEMAGPGD